MERHLSAIFPDGLQDRAELRAIDVELLPALVERLFFERLSYSLQLPLELSRCECLLQLDLPRLQHVVDAVIGPDITGDSVSFLYMLLDWVTRCGLLHRLWICVGVVPCPIKS